MAATPYDSAWRWFRSNFRRHLNSFIPATVVPTVLIAALGAFLVAGASAESRLTTGAAAAGIGLAAGVTVAGLIGVSVSTREQRDDLRVRANELVVAVEDLQQRPVPEVHAVELRSTAETILDAVRSDNRWYLSPRQERLALLEHFPALREPIIAWNAAQDGLAAADERLSQALAAVEAVIWSEAVPWSQTGAPRIRISRVGWIIVAQFLKKRARWNIHNRDSIWDGYRALRIDGDLFGNTPCRLVFDPTGQQREEALLAEGTGAEIAEAKEYASKVLHRIVRSTELKDITALYDECWGCGAALGEQADEIARKHTIAGGCPLCRPLLSV